MGKFLDSVKNKKVDNNKNTSSATKNVGKFGMSVMKSKIGLDTLETDLQSLGDTVENAYRGWHSPDGMNNIKASIESMQQRLQAYQEYAKVAGIKDAADVSSVMEGYQAYLNDWDNRAATYSKFKNPTEYLNAKLREESLHTVNLDSLSSSIADLDKQIAAVKEQEEKDYREYLGKTNDVNPLTGWQAKSSKYKKQIEELENQKADKEAFYKDATSAREARATQEKEKAMASDPKNMEGYNKYVAGVNAQIAETNDKSLLEQWASDVGVMSDNPFNYAMNVTLRNKREDKTWQLPQGDWSDEERRVLGGYYSTDPQKALDYVVRKNNEKAKAEQAKTEAGIQGYATTNLGTGTLSTAGAILAAPFGLADYLDDVTDKLAGRPIIEEGMVTPFEFSQAVTGGISTHLNEMSGTLNENIPVIGGKGLGDLYGLGTSVAQSAASAYTMGSLGTLVSYFGQGAAAGVDDALSRGATDDQALFYGLVLGAAEGISENIGAERLLKLGSPNEIRKLLVGGFKNGGKQFWSLVNKQGLAEGIEEGFSGIIGQVADNFILKGKSNFEALTKEYRALGMSATEATKKAWMKSIGDVAYDTLSGYLSGAIHAAPQIVGSSIKQNTENKSIGQTIRGNERVSDMLSIASLSPQESDAFAAYTEYAKRGVNAENITDAQLGNLYGMADADARATAFSKKSSTESAMDALGTASRLNAVMTENEEAKKAKESTQAEAETEGIVATPTRESYINEQSKGMSEAEAKLFRSLDDGHTNAENYTDSFNYVVRMAQNKFSQGYILEHRGVLSTAQVSEIYKAVVTDPNMAQQKTLDAMVREQGDNLEIKGTIDDSVIDYDNTGAEGKVNWNDLHPNVRATIAYVSGFATKLAGLDVKLVTNGRDHGFRGKYDRQGNTLYIDITASKESLGTDTKGRKKGDAKFIMSAVAHEVTHWMEEKAPELYAQYDKMVMDALTSGGKTEDRVLLERRVLLELAESKRAEKDGRKPREITDDEVRREVIARASEDMLALSEEGKKFFESMTESEQKTFVDKIKAVLRNITTWIKNVLSKLKSNSPEAEMLRELAQDLDAISKKWDEMLRAAAKANAAMKKAGVNDKAITESKTGADTQNSDIDETVQEQFQKDFEDAVDKILASKNHGITGSVVIGRTPTALTQIGISQLPLTITPAHVYSIAKTEAEAKAEGRYQKGTNYHGLGADAVKQIGKELSKPIMVLQHQEFTQDQKNKSASTHKVIAVVELVVGGKRVIAPIEIDAEVRLGNKRYDSNHVATYFGDDRINRLYREAIAKENIGDIGFFYLDKKRAMQIFKSAGINYPKTLNTHNSNIIVRDIALKVNKKISNFTQSQQFKRWFGDWQNNPDEASKVVNADGTPKIMYHGSPYTFSVFDRKKARPGLYGRGFYFTDSASHGGQYGDTRAFYLDVKNPLDASSNSHRITQKQLKAFLVEVANNEDYGIENYGEYATVDSVMKSLEGKSDFAILQDINTTSIGDFVAAIELFNQVNGTHYDGIITPTETVVFSSNQVKSATDNRGTFDKDNPDVYYSDIDEEYMDAVERGDELSQQMMVDEAARKAGFSTEHLYHGTGAFGFTVTDTSYSDDGISFFLSNDPNVAESYFPVKKGDKYRDSVRRIGKKADEAQTRLSENADVNSVLDRVRDALPEDYSDARVATEAEVLADLNDFYIPNIEKAARELQNYDVPPVVRRLVDAVIKAADVGTYEAWKGITDRATEFFDIKEITYNGQYWYQADSLWGNIYVGVEKANDLIHYGAIVHNNGSIISKKHVVTEYNDTLKAESLGIYDMYTRRDGQLIIDGRGRNWNDIPLGSIIEDFNKWYVEEQGHEEALNGLWATANTRNIAKYAKDRGYRSVLFDGISDMGMYSGENTVSSVYAYFYPNEDVKSADPVTYDDAGEVIPLSQRFDSGNEDIRYSDIDEDSEGAKLSAAQQEYFKDSKVRDEDGKLLVLYRSADGGRTVWDGRGGDSWAKGIYLTDDLYVARAFAYNGRPVRDSDVLRVYARAVNPLVIDAQGSNYMDIPMPEDAPEWLIDSGDWEGRLNADQLPITAFEHGYDAVIIKNVREGVGGGPATDVILRDANQLKRTDNTTPTEDPDIRYSDIDELDDLHAQLKEKQSQIYSASMELRKFDSKAEEEKLYAVMQKDGVSKEELDAALQAYAKWGEESGYAEASKKLSALKDEEKLIRREIQKVEDRLHDELKEQIAHWSDEDVKKYVGKAVRKYHTTSRLENASYLLTTGSMLDFSDGQGYRVKDHREISEILDLPDYAEYSDGMIAFMNMGNIRLQTYGIDVSAMPNAKQFSTLRDIIFKVMRENDEFSVDFSKTDGYSAGSVTYGKGTSTSKIIADIKSFFETGVVPEEQSSLRDFLYSDIDPEVDIYEVLGENKRLAKENKKLREDFERLVERLKLERQLTHGNHFNKNQLDAVAGHIRNIANSTYSKTELVKKLEEVYTYLATSKEVTWDNLFARLYGIAEDVLRESKTTVVNDYYANIYRELRNTEISLSEKQKKYIKDMLGVDWNKAFFGKIKVSDKGVPLNSKWEEWAAKYPNEFAEDKELDQVLALLEIYDTAKELKEVVEEYSDVEQARWLANELYNQYWNVSTIRTTADKYDQQIKRLNFEHRKAMKELRDSYEERLASQKKADKEKRSELFKKIREKHQEELQEVRAKGKERMDKYKEEAARRTRIQSITAQALTLNEWLVKNSKDKHIHESMKGPVTALLQAIDFSSKRALGMWGGDMSGVPTNKDISLQKALSQVQKMMADASVGKEDLVLLYGHELDADIASMIESVDNIMRTVGDNEFVLQKMTLDDLITLDNVVKTIRHAVSQMNKFHTVHHAKGIANLAQEEIAYADKLGKARVYKDESKKAGVIKLLAWRNINPYYAFKRFGAAGKKIFEAFQDGYDKFAYNIKEIIDFTKKTYKREEVRAWEKEVKTFKIKMPATEEAMSQPDYEPQYQEIKMTVAQVMDLYLLSKREAAKEHLLGGGIRVADIEIKGGEVISQTKGALLEQSEIDAIVKSLTPRQVEVADALSHFMNTTTTEWGNEVSMARFGYRAFGEKHYVPMQVDKNNVSANDETEKNNSLFRLLNMSFTKSLTEKASNRLVVSSIFDVFAQHTSDMAKYNALALPVLDAFRWYNYKEKGYKGDTAYDTRSVQQAIESAFGKDGQSYITTFLKDLNGQENTSRDTLGKGFFTKAKIASVAANLRVVFLQPTAYFRASANIDSKYLRKALMHKPKIGRAEKYCGMALWKSLGYFDTNVQRGVADQIKHAETPYDRAIEASMKGAEWADKITFGYLWNAAELEIRDKRKDLKVGSKEFYTEVGKRLRDIIYSTQVVDSVMTRSEMMRSSDRGDKLLTAFASEPTISYNMLADAYLQTRLDARELGSKKAAIKKNAKYITSVIVAYTTTNLAAALVESGFDILRDDDDEEEAGEVLKLYFENFATNQSIVAKIPWLKELVSIAQGFSSSRMDTQGMQAFANLLKQAMKLTQGEGSVAKTIKSAAQAASYLTGLPFYNAYRDLLAAIDQFFVTDEELEEVLKDLY